MALRRRIKDGYVILKRGYWNDLPPKVRQALSRLSLVNGGNHERKFYSTGLFAIYAINENDEIVGWANFYRPAKPYDYIYLYTKRSERRKGIGSVLLNDSIRYFRKFIGSVAEKKSFFYVDDNPEFFGSAIYGRGNFSIRNNSPKEKGGWMPCVDIVQRSEAEATLLD